MNKFAISKIINAAAVAAIVAVSMPATTTPSLAYSCKVYPEQADAYLKTKFAARAKAIKNWSTKTKNQYGLAWSVWDIAKDKTVECKLVNGKWTCKAKAKPCLYVVP